MPPRRCYLLNPAANGGRAGSRAEHLARHLQSQGLHGSWLHASQPGDLQRLATQSRHADLVVAVGGDGTVMEIITGLLLDGPPHATLALLPLGSGNDAARMFHLHTLPAALATLHHGIPRPIDVLELQVTRHHQPVRLFALGFAGAAFTADIMLATPPPLKRWLGGSTAYALGFFRALLHAQSHPVRATLDGHVLDQPTLAVIAANQPTAGGGLIRIAPGARPDDGRMEVTLVRYCSRFEVVRQFLRLLRGTHLGHPAVTFQSGVDLLLDAPHPVLIQADGDVLGSTPARITLRPAALQMLLPPV